MGSYIWRYFYTIILLWVANWALAWSADNFELACFIIGIGNPIMMIWRGVQIYRERSSTTETSHRIMCILTSYMCWSGGLWAVYNFLRMC